MTTSAVLDYFARSVSERLFVARPDALRRVGAEIEMLPLLEGSLRPCPLEEAGDDPRSTLSFVRAHGDGLGWREERSAKGAPYFKLPNGWTLTFEPGGQLELCTVPSASISHLLSDARSTIGGLRRAAAGAGIELASVGIDPYNDISSIPLQLHSARYERMTRYFARIGPSGVRMMRQTAATQVSLDPGSAPQERWRLLGDLTPYLTAMFANSPCYAGRETGYRSFRARCWRLLDSSRTGIPYPELPASEAYTRFALDAGDMTRTDADGAYRAFGDWVAEGEWSEAAWEDHLTTLFPEVRPRGHLEVRSLDALGPEMIGAPIVLLAGLVYDRSTADDVRRMLPAGDEEMLNRAAECGLGDRRLAQLCAELARLGLRGARSLGEEVVGGEELERAEQYFTDWTLSRRSPADAR
ncbi:MAG TPA: glutamate-cysteine ligase family protein [Gemmatimonadaceae bacterium]|jgi:glutamate--cysteine ligase